MSDVEDIITAKVGIKRTYKEALLPQELINRFRSKSDLIRYCTECL